MTSVPIAGLLLFNAVLGARVVFKEARGQTDAILVSLLFFCSGMPALIYQIIWQRALFVIYGVNSQSVAVIVTAFMLGLGLGSLIGGWLSARFPQHGILIFGVAELGIAGFGLSSLPIFHWMAARTAGASLPWVIVFSLLLLLVPTILMGATLPLLVEHLVSRTGRVGFSVSVLYFVNTFGSAVACYLCASFLLRDFGQKGSVTIAACLNTIVGVTAYLYSRSAPHQPNRNEDIRQVPDIKESISAAPLPLGIAMILAGFSGFIALGLELAWFRVYSLASSDRAPAFALLLAIYLAGIAAGSYLAETWTEGRSGTTIIQVVATMLLLAGALSPYVPPLVASLRARGIPFFYSAPVCFAVAAAMGSVLPLLCQLAVVADSSAGRRVSLVYLSNILGSALGCLGIGFVVMDHLGLVQICKSIAILAVILGIAVTLIGRRKITMPPFWAIALILAAFLLVPASSRLYTSFFERLIFGPQTEGEFTRLVENRSGIIAVTQQGAVFGGGVYDGFFNIDPLHDVNMIVRIYAISSFCPAPKRVLVIGLSSGSWVQVIGNHPQLESMDVIEINPGYLKLIPEYPAVQSILHNPRINFYIDDGRRWLIAHPDARYDAIVVNTSFHWRDHVTNLLSAEFMALVRAHLNPRGVYYFNTTSSHEAIATALHTFRYGVRVINFLAVSDSPIVVNGDRLLDILRRYKIDGNTTFDPVNPAAQLVLVQYNGLLDSVHRPPVFFGMESADSLRRRLRSHLIITDDNMGLEWRDVPQLEGH